MDLRSPAEAAVLAAAPPPGAPPPEPRRRPRSAKLGGAARRLGPGDLISLFNVSCLAAAAYPAHQLIGAA